MQTVLLVNVRPTNEIFIYKNLKRCWNLVSTSGYDVLMVVNNEATNGSTEVQTYLKNYVGMWRYFFEEHKIIISAYNSNSVRSLSRTYIIQEMCIM